MCQPGTIAASETRPLEEPACAARCQKNPAFPQILFGARLRNTMVKNRQRSFSSDALAAGAALLLARRWKIWWEGRRKKKKKDNVEKDISLRYPRASTRCKLFGFVPCESVPQFNFQRLMCPSPLLSADFLLTARDSRKAPLPLDVALCRQHDTLRAKWNTLKRRKQIPKDSTCLKPQTVHWMYGQPVPIKASAF